MKKKVATTLLATMLSVSMAAAPVMAFDDDAAGFEVTAEDFGSEVTEETPEDTAEDESTLSKFDNIDNPVSKLSDGVYKVQGEMYKVNKVDYSMSNNAINHNIKLTVKDGLPYISMNFNGMDVSSLRGYLKNLSYYKTGFEFDKYGNPVGDLADVTIDSYQQFSDGSMFEDDFDTDYPNAITFPLVLEAIEDGDDCNYVPLQVYVPVMEALSEGSGKQNVFLKLDYSTITKTTADDK